MPNTDGPSELIVVSHRNWLAEELSDAASARTPPLPVVHNYGFDVPWIEPDAQPAWWTPAEHAARLLKLGVRFPLLCPGPYWLSSLPIEVTGRTVWTGRVDEITGCGMNAGYCKPAEAKMERFPARWWDNVSDYAGALTAALVPPDAIVQVADTLLKIGSEYRVLILDDEPVAVATYLVNDRSDTLIGGDRLGEHSLARPSDALAFVRSLSGVLPECSPSVYVVDVAVTTVGEWVVLEANNVWSANPYTIDRGLYVEALLAAADYGNREPRWHFRPDAWLVFQADRKPVLPRRLTR